MHVIAGVAGLLLVVAVLVDAFETVVLSRRVTRRWRITTAINFVTWKAYRAAVHKLRPVTRELVLGYYGPGSLLLLFGCWAALLILGFGAASWGFGIPGSDTSFGTALYNAGSTFFTLGLGAAAPSDAWARILVVAMAGTGFGFLALVIAYLPTLYQAFSRREIYISQLDARAGSPPSAGELLARHEVGDADHLTSFLAEWERWSADLMESVLSFPALGYYRSHHDNQSWLASLVVLLDTCTVVLAGHEEGPRRQARLTYAMCRHAAVDLAQVMHVKPKSENRLDPAALERLRERISGSGWHLPESSIPVLTKLRAAYEPYVVGLSEELLMPLPEWAAPERGQDVWRMTELDERGRRRRIDDGEGRRRGRAPSTGPASGGER
jgi:hypothetical protein